MAFARFHLNCSEASAELCRSTHQVMEAMGCPFSPSLPIVAIALWDLLVLFFQVSSSRPD
jgi:hypothetical protein